MNRLFRWLFLRPCDRCGRSKLGLAEHIPIHDTPGACWLVFAPGAAERSDALR